MEIDLTNPDDQEWLSGGSEYETLRYSERHSEAEIRGRSDRILEGHLAKMLPDVVAEEVEELTEAEAEHVARWTIKAITEKQFATIKDEAKEEVGGDTARERVRKFRNRVATAIIEVVGRDDVCFFAVFVRQIREHIAKVLRANAYKESDRLIEKGEEGEKRRDLLVTAELATKILNEIDPDRFLEIRDSVDEEAKDEDHWDGESVKGVWERLAKRIIAEVGDTGESGEPTKIEPLFLDVEDESERQYQDVDLISGLVVALYDINTSLTIDQLVDRNITQLKFEELYTEHNI